ncbi:MAG: aldo/keto reductase [Acidobacteriia bacterium]|nr:aldo/keto reductase [Terriglobia bacterium]
MQYTRLGNSGLIVSRMAYGVMTFGVGAGSSHPMAHIWKTPQAEAEALVGRALDVGINIFDTADAYTEGQAEIMLAQALGARRKDVVISTKVGFRTGPGMLHTGGSFQHVVGAAEASLRRLKTDYIDLLSIHRLDRHTPLEETARALENLVQRGLVRYVGYSNFNAWQSAKLLGIQQHMGYSPVIAAQMYYSLVGRDLEHEVVPFCKDAGIGIVVWSPLAGGFLSGRYTRKDPTGGKGRLEKFDFIPFDKEKGYELIGRMQAMAADHKATVAQLALAWLLSKEHVAVIIIGASNVNQFDDNLHALEVNLTRGELDELDQLTKPATVYPNWFQDKTQDTAVTKALAK